MGSLSTATAIGIAAIVASCNNSNTLMR
ncbi:MAG: Vmc-like lipoprotein signal peptide domain-containing protein [Pyrobaculum sp.]